MSAGVEAVNPVAGVEVGVGRHTGGDVAHRHRLSRLRVVVESEVIVVGVAVELGRHRPLEPGDDPGVLPSPGSQTLPVTRRDVAQQRHLLPGQLCLAELCDEPGESVPRVGPVQPQEEVVGQTEGGGQTDQPLTRSPGVAVTSELSEGLQLRRGEPRTEELGQLGEQPVRSKAGVNTCRGARKAATRLRSVLALTEEGERGDLHVAGERFMVAEGWEDLSVGEDLSQGLQNSRGSVEVLLAGLEPDVVCRVVARDHDVLQARAVLLPDVLQHLNHSQVGCGDGGGVGTLL